MAINSIKINTDKDGINELDVFCVASSLIAFEKRGFINKIDRKLLDVFCVASGLIAIEKHGFITKIDREEVLSDVLESLTTSKTKYDILITPLEEKE
ncbi:MAG: hypothetical protein EKK56_00865 [Flavobacteriaceae bacterium]|nr:MAG: hypothetical protein EKK56_00865 [Flavobacteriaceae bacterium]